MKKFTKETLLTLTKAELLRLLAGANESDHSIGTVTWENFPPRLLSLLVRQQNCKVAYYLEHISEDARELRTKIESLRIPTYAQFQRILDDSDKKKGVAPQLRKPRDHFAYRQWVLSVPPLSTWFQNLVKKPFPAYLPLKARARHSYIIGASGSGKSVTLQTLILKDKLPTENDPFPVSSKTAVVLIEPHGDLALDTARQKIFFDDYQAHRRRGSDDWNLIYLDPTLGAEHEKYFVFNLFDVAEKKMSERQLDRTAQQFTQAFLAMLGSGQELSLNMATMLHPVLMTLLRRSGSTMADLLKFLNDDDELVALGKCSPNEHHRHFFKARFQASAFARTKQSVATKIQSLLNYDIFAKCFCQTQSTIDFEAAMTQGKTIIINLAKGKLGAELSSAMGKLFVASLLAIAFNRADSNAARTPISLVLDECQNFINPSIKTILTEARKYRLQLTLAQQIVGQNMDAELRRCVLGNTAVQGVGVSANYSRDKMSAEFGIPAHELSNLRTGQFIWKVGAEPPITIQMTGEYLAPNCRVSSSEWAELRNAMIDRYYLPLEPTAEDLDRSQLREEILASQVPIRSNGSGGEPAFPIHHFDVEEL